MIWTLRTKLLRYEDEWSADIEIDSSSTLEELHYAIQKAVNFDNDHLCAFYIARSDSSRNREFLDDDFMEWAGEFDPEYFDAGKTTKAMRRGLPDWRQYR